jgi:hypothetical protein
VASPNHHSSEHQRKGSQASRRLGLEKSLLNTLRRILQSVAAITSIDLYSCYEMRELIKTNSVRDLGEGSVSGKREIHFRQNVEREDDTTAIPSFAPVSRSQRDGRHVCRSRR